MKRTTHFCTTAEIKLNLDKAIKILGENGFLSFAPAPEYQVKAGFVAITLKPNRTLYAEIVLLRSRGSFLEMRANSEVFEGITIKLLRQYLSVSICLGKTLPPVTDTSQHVHPDDREDYKSILTQARL